MTRNPYIFGKWVSRDNFYGREKLIDEILYGPNDALWIIGNRRVGKTSLLKQLEWVTARSNEFFSVFWDMEGCDTYEQLSVELVEAVQDAQMYNPRLDLDFASLTPSDLTMSLRVLVRQLHQRGLRLLLLCDEVEVLINIAAHAPAELQRIRKALHSPSIRVVITSAKGLSKLNDLCVNWDTSSFLHGFSARYLGELEHPEAEALVRQTRRDPPVNVDEITLHKIIALAAKHPFLMQILCDRLYQENSNSLQKVDTARDLTVDETLSSYFQIDFNNLSDSERVIILQVGRHPGITEAELTAKLQMPQRVARSFITTLSYLGYLNRRMEDRLFIGNYLFFSWLRTRNEQLARLSKSSVSDRAVLTTIIESPEADKISELARLMKSGLASREYPHVLVLGTGVMLSDHIRDMGFQDTVTFYKNLDAHNAAYRFPVLSDMFKKLSPSRGYFALAKLIKAGYFDLILTTNFDTLLEDALVKAGVRTSDFKVLINGETPEDQILHLVKQPTPRIKILKLHGDLNARVFAFTPQEVAEFSEKIEMVVKKYLAQNVVIVGHTLRDDDINRCLSSARGGSIWYVNSAPPVQSALIRRALKRRKAVQILGPKGAFDTFFELLLDEINKIS